MPSPGWRELLFCGLIPIGQIWLLVWIIRRGISRLWIALCTTLAVSALGGIVALSLLILDAVTGAHSTLIPALYFYSYWYATMIVACLQLWLLWEVAARITGCSNRPWLRWSFAAIAFAAAVGAIAISHHARTPVLPHPVTQMATLIDRTIWVAWCLLFVGLTLSADLIGLKWRRQIIGVTLGFVVQAVAGTFYSWLLTSRNAATMDALANCAWILSLSIWAFALREPPYLLLTPALEAAFEDSLRQLEMTHKEVQRTCL